MATEIAKAYVQIIPTTNNIGTQLEKELGGAGGGAGEKVGAGFMSAIGGAIAKGAAAVGAAASAAVGAIAKQAVDGFAEYEQLAGGAELLFGEKAFETVSENAKKAFETVQMSQNDYLQQVNGFATGLKTALGGNEQGAAELADRIVKAEADIVAATGNTQESVQNAFNGIMRSNYTMLDNLQLGITPTKEGFQSLIDSVNEYNAAHDNATNYQIDNLADAQSALLDYIEIQGLAGYASMEAAGTIEGSTASMKAAWANLITGLADENADISQLIGDLVKTIVGENGKGGVLNNIMPRIEKTLYGIGDLIAGLAPVIVDVLPGLVENVLPPLIDAAMELFNGALDVVVENLPMLVDVAMQIVETVVGGLLDNLDKIVSAALDLIFKLGESLMKFAPQLLDAAVSIIVGLADMLTSQDNIGTIIETALSVVIKLAEGLMDAIPQLVAAAFEIINGIVEFLLDPENLVKLIAAAIEIVIAIGAGLVSAIPQLVVAAIDLINSLIDTFKNKDWKEIGKNIIDGILGGLKAAWENLKKWFTNAWDNLVAGTKDLLGIHSPSTVFAGIGKQVAAGIGIGFGDEFDSVQRDVASEVGDLAGSAAISASVSANVAAGQGTDVTSTIIAVADMIVEAIRQKDMSVSIGDRDVYRAWQRGSQAIGASFVR